MNKETFKQLLTTQIPIAWIAGVRLESAAENEIKTYVELDFLNQNPFKSMFWAVEGMAAEFAGGMMLLEKIRKSGKNVSTLVTKNEAVFTKKAVGKIVFTCGQGEEIDQAIREAVKTNEGITIKLTSLGTDEAGEQVAQFDFTWSIKLRNG